MLKLADIEKEYLVACAHCAKPMPAWELFCPSCNGEQSSPETAVDAKVVAAAAPPEDAEAHRPRPEDWESIDQLVSTTAANEEIGFGLGHVRPGAVWQDGDATASPLQPERGSNFGFGRVALGLSATLAVVLLTALLYDTFMLRQDGVAVTASRVGASDASLSKTSGRDDSVGAQSAVGNRAKGETAAAAAPEKGADDPPEIVVREEPNREVALTAAQALGLGDLAALPAPTLSPRTAPAADLPTAPSSAAEPTDKACTAAHAALALCQTR